MYSDRDQINEMKAELSALQSKYAAVVAELECASNDIKLRDKEIAALKSSSLQDWNEIETLKTVIIQIEDAFDSLNDEIPTIRAETIREAIGKCRDAAQMYDRSGVIQFCTTEDLEEYASSLEQGND